jgi:hypothetical protein
MYNGVYFLFRSINLQNVLLNFGKRLSIELCLEALLNGAKNSKSIDGGVPC